MNGVIQIFNLFNLRNAKLTSALKKLKAGDCNPQYVHTFKEDLSNLHFPVYLGWGDLLDNSYFKKHHPAIEAIFNKAKESALNQGKNWPLASTLNAPENHFFHPQFFCLHPHSADDAVEAEKKVFLHKKEHRPVSMK
ncbi:MAG: hypothetical protein ILP18_01955 [Treponema sp.]|nr:hypothetical protein [Treponema sp.]